MPPADVAAPWVFSGVRLQPALCAAGARARRWREQGGEFVRPVVRAADWRREWTEEGPEAETWTVDFPPGAHDRAVERAGEAGRAFSRSGARIARQGAGAELRIALAKVGRYLATPAGAKAARWRWLPATMLPCGELVVVARDDEFLAGVLASRWLAEWRAGVRGERLVDAVRSLPLPWAPDLGRGALTREQDERREAVVRAWRDVGAGMAEAATAADARDELSEAVAAAYGWSKDIDADEGLRRLRVMAPE